jgi:hypothetical protein
VRSAGANRVGPHGYRHNELCRFELCGDMLVAYWIMRNSTFIVGLAGYFVGESAYFIGAPGCLWARRRALQPGGRCCKHKQIRRPGTGAVTATRHQEGGAKRPRVALSYYYATVL